MIENSDPEQKTVGAEAEEPQQSDRQRENSMTYEQIQHANRYAGFVKGVYKEGVSSSQAREQTEGVLLQLSNLQARLTLLQSLAQHIIQNQKQKVWNHTVEDFTEWVEAPYPTSDNEPKFSSIFAPSPYRFSSKTQVQHLKVVKKLYLEGLKKLRQNQVRMFSQAAFLDTHCSNYIIFAEGTDPYNLRPTRSRKAADKIAARKMRP